MSLFQALVTLAALLIVTPASVGAHTDQGIDPCATAPRNGDGDNLLRSLCIAIRKIANGEPELAIAPPRIDPAQPPELKLWRNANGTMIDIDFGGGSVGSAVIARLLSGSVFVPTDRIDLLVIRNADLLGTLDLSDATIELAVKFNKIRFEQYSCATERTEWPGQAIRLVGTHAKKRLSLIDSQLCGDLVISGSRLDGGIEISGTIAEPGLDCVTGQAYALTSLFVVKSTIQSDILLRSTCILRATSIERSTVNSLTLADAEFRGPIDVVHNTIGALSGWDSKFHDRVQITNNRVQAELNMSVATFAPGSAPVVRDNAVDGRLQVTIREIGRGKIIDLPYNRVEQASAIWLPRGWRGRLNLNDTAFQSVLSLCMADYDDTAKTLKPHHANAAEEAVLRDCPKTSANPKDRMDYMVVNLKSAEVTTLAWRLPLKCSIRWEGTGLRYGNWGEGRGTGAVLSEYQCRELMSVETTESIRPTKGLMLMRYVMMENDVDALDAMADYLASKGKMLESRRVRVEARKVNYLSLFDGWWWGLIVSVALWPFGYGVIPELGLWWLFCIWGVSFIIYRSYSLALRRNWRKELGDQERASYSTVPGFERYDSEKDPRDFSLLTYSIDAMLPFINLHTYDRYYATSGLIRLYAGLQHALGWLLITVVIAMLL